jgi:hypothetical protein
VTALAETAPESLWSIAEGYGDPREGQLVLSEAAYGWKTRPLQPQEIGDLQRHIERRLHQATALKLLQIRPELPEQGGWNPCIRVGPGGKCGFTSTTEDNAFVEVRPKVEQADYLGLMLLSEGLEGLVWSQDAWLGGTGPQSLLELLASALVHEVKTLLRSTGPRRRHERENETLVARIRGQVRMGRYLNQVASGRPLHVPCTFERHQVDNLPNRTLRWALRVLRVALERTAGIAGSNERRMQVIRDLRQHEAIFADFGVPLVPVRAAALRGLVRLPSGFDAYRSALRVAGLVIRNLAFEISGGTLRSISLAIDLASVFEGAFALLVKRRFHSASVSQKSWQLELAPFGTPGSGFEANGRLVPDVVLEGEKTTLVLDTKWKSVIDRASQGSTSKARLEDGVMQATPQEWTSNIALNYGDLHQMWSYLHVASVHRPHHRVAGALVYPVASENREVTPRPIEIRPRMSQSCHSGERRLFLLPWEVGRGHFTAGCTRLLDTLHELLQGADIQKPIRPTE